MVTKDISIGICGHIGVGHAHSHSGIVQDDGAGFTVVASLLKESYPVNTKIKTANVNINDSTISIITNDGGNGEVFVSCGITPWEKDIIENIVGLDGIFNQQIVLKSFGRIYGQGAMEVCASLQNAIALSVLDSFVRMYPKEFTVADEDIPLTKGKMLCGRIKIVDYPVVIMLTINSTEGGIGPIEDLEGNIPLGNKGRLMKKYNLHKLPSIIVESKNYNRALCEDLIENTFLIRANKTYDNITVAEALLKGAKASKIPCIYDFEAFPRDTQVFTEAGIDFGERIIELGKDFKKADTSSKKVKISYKLNKLAREEAGGVTFMSNLLNESVGGAGVLKGTAAVLSLLVTKDNINYEKIPYMNEEDIRNYLKIIKEAIPILGNNIDKAQEELDTKWNFNEREFENLLYRR